jgi:hypothetical protein
LVGVGVVKAAVGLGGKASMPAVGKGGKWMGGMIDTEKMAI